MLPHEHMGTQSLAGLREHMEKTIPEPSFERQRRWLDVNSVRLSGTARRPGFPGAEKATE